MQKGEGVRGGLRWWLVLLTASMSMLCPVVSRAYDLPGAVARGMGRTGLPGIYRSREDSLPGKRTLKISLSYSNPYSIKGLDFLEAGSIFQTERFSFRSIWRSLRHSAFREDRIYHSLYFGARHGPVVPLLASLMWRRRAGRFEPERGHAVEGGIVIPIRDRLLIETVVPLSDGLRCMDDRLVLRMLLMCGPVETCANFHFPQDGGPVVRYGVRWRLSGRASLLAGYDTTSSVMTAGVIIGRGRTSFVIAREYHPVLGSTCSAGVERSWSI